MNLNFKKLNPGILEVDTDWLEFNGKSLVIEFLG